MYIVIENFPENQPAIVTDDSGEVKFFETEQQAQIEVNDCQNGIIVEL